MDMTEANIKLEEIIKERKKVAFIPEYQDRTTEPEALGIIISQYFEWDGLRILETFSNALEDANFHSENEKVCEMIERVKNA